MNSTNIIILYLVVTSVLTFFVALTKYNIATHTRMSSIVTSVAMGLLLGWLLWPVMLNKLFNGTDKEAE
jgi:hypothetical protein